ncbi:aspartyl-phosphate phosphatase Spo0E family protein [Bacillaceae bacterium IKA-2]|nr:aspartyl-phosphate phosphatase Spo0E family protein [Bacillaceae bacterium IKA-2]
MLVEVIEKKRLHMIYLASILGMSSNKTIKCSQELDELLNLVQNNVFKY